MAILGENDQILKGRLPSTPLGLEVNRRSTATIPNFPPIAPPKIKISPCSDPTMRGRRVGVASRSSAGSQAFRPDNEGTASLDLNYVPLPQDSSDPTMRGRRSGQEDDNAMGCGSSDPTTRGRRRDYTALCALQRDGSDPTARGRRLFALIVLHRSATSSDPTMRGRRLLSCESSLALFIGSDPTTRGRRRHRQ